MVVAVYDQQISQAAIEEILYHLWYLYEETAALAFFEDEVSAAEKRKMVTAVQYEDLLCLFLVHFILGIS